MAKYIYAGANTDEQFRTEVLLSFREPQIYFFSRKFAKSSLFMYIGVETVSIPWRS